MTAFVWTVLSGLLCGAIPIGWALFTCEDTRKVFWERGAKEYPKIDHMLEEHVKQPFYTHTVAATSELKPKAATLRRTHDFPLMRRNP